MRPALLCVLLGLAVATPGSAALQPPEIVFSGPYAGVSVNVLAIRPDGSGLRLVVAGGSEGHLPTNPRWSPDGTRILFSPASGGDSAGLATVLSEGGRPRILTTKNDVPVDWSRDGRWIAFTRYENRAANLYAVRSDGTGERKLRGRTSALSWTPDSRHLLISYKQGLATTDLRGRVRVVPNAACAGDGAFSPNGRWFAFARCLGKPYHMGIAVQRADGTGLRWLAKPVSALGNWSPAWSPDGTRIAYVEERPVSYLEHTEIRLVSLQGKRLGNLDSHAADHDEYPAWSPDGTQIVFDRDAAVEPIGEADRLFVGDVRTGRVRKLYDNIWRGSQSWRPR